MMAQQVAHPISDKKRVKVYELRMNDWYDRGTGFCTAQFLQTEDGQPKEPHVLVEAEDGAPRILLQTKIVRPGMFQRQQDTLIVWTEDTTDMALSFQEAEGCTLVWKFVNNVQETLRIAVNAHNKGSEPVMMQPLADSSRSEDGLSDDLGMDMTTLITLPPAELGNLEEIENSIRTCANAAHTRDGLAKTIMHEDYIKKLVPMVEMAEDLESLEDLHRLCNIVKMVIQLNDTAIIEHAMSDECVLGVVGALEYDPDFPSHKANHRQWLTSRGRFKEVVRIDEEHVRRKIHQTYRLQYLKDVVLARILDDPTYSVVNSLIFFNQVDILQYLQCNGAFLSELFGIFADPIEHPLRKKEAVLFIQQCCSIAKNIQPPNRQNLYSNFLAHGLLQVIHFGLRNRDVTVRVGATDILISLIDHDPQVIRNTIYRQAQEKQAPLMEALVDLLLVEVDLGVKSQLSDALKVLLDSTGPPDSRAEAGSQVAVRAQVDAQQELFLNRFYDRSAVRLFKPLLDLEKQDSDVKVSVADDGIFAYLNDILCFLIRQHHYHVKHFILQNNIMPRYVQLLSCKEKHQQLVAIRFFRQLVILQDEFYVNQLATREVLGPVLDLLIRIMPRDNLLSSACLDLFNEIVKDNVKELISFLMENCRERIMALAHLDIFDELVRRYDQTRGHPTDQYCVDSEDEGIRRLPHPGRGNLMEHLSVDPAQEEYWNTSDEEEEPPPGQQAERPSTANGSKPLVEYNSDDEMEDNDVPVLPSDPSTGRGHDHPGEQGLRRRGGRSSGPSAMTGPPEWLVEKRRREEDEEDEMSKLMQNKRRNTTSASTNSVSVAGTMKETKSLSGSRAPSPHGARRTSISISSSVKTAVGKAAAVGRMISEED